MAGNAIDEKIETAISEMEFYLNELPRRDARLTQYTVPSISVTDITPTGDGGFLAQIEVDIRKDRAKYRQGTEYRYYKDLDEYWSVGAKYHLRKKSLTLAAKAVILLQMRDNVARNWSQDRPEAVKRLGDVIEELVAELIAAREETGEVDTFPVRLDTLKRRDPRLRNARSLKIVKLHKGIFLDSRNRGKLDAHEKAGRFERGECCTFRIARQILFD